MELKELISLWDSNEGKPYKGRLIDWSEYEGDGEEPPTNIGCMCAQGQVLHLLGGWSPRKLNGTEQREADKETAKLLGISIAHAVILRRVNDSVDGAPSIVLTNPEKILGDQAHIILAFWKHIDRMTHEDWQKVIAARNAARDVARNAAASSAAAAAWNAALDAAWDAALAYSEIQGASVMRECGQPFFFLPMFGFASPEEIPLS
jgi:hypothetical protein